MKKIRDFFATLLVLSLILPAGINIANAGEYATVFNPETGERKVVRVGDPHAFDGGFMLEVAYGYVLAEENEVGFTVVSSYEVKLSSSMNSTQTTVPVTSMQTKDGHTLTMADLGGKAFLTIEPGGSKEEIVMCTGISGNNFIGCTRGLAFYGTSTASVSSNRKTHSAGSRVIMSNVHYVYEEMMDKDSNETIGGDKIFTGNIEFKNLPISTTTAPTLDEQLATKKYVDNVAVAGAPDATETVKGIAELATGEEAAAGTSVGSTGARLVLPSSIATTTADMAGNHVVITDSDGKLNHSLLDLSDNFNFTGNVKIDGDTTLASTTVTATTTFEIPPIASSSPIDQRQLVNKYYVDNTFSTIHFSGEIIDPYEGVINCPSVVSTTSLSNLIGNKKSLVLIAVKDISDGVGVSNVNFYGAYDTYYYDSPGVVYDGFVNAINLDDGEEALIFTITDSNGNIRWNCSNSDNVKLVLVAYIQ